MREFAGEDGHRRARVTREHRAHLSLCTMRSTSPMMKTLVRSRGLLVTVLMAFENGSQRPLFTEAASHEPNSLQPEQRVDDGCCRASIVCRLRRSNCLASVSSTLGYQIFGRNMVRVGRPAVSCWVTVTSVPSGFGGSNGSPSCRRTMETPSRRTRKVCGPTFISVEASPIDD
jgi:hypothetical protein